MKDFYIKDGVWHNVHSHMTCCDCGLTHRVEYRDAAGTLQCRVWRDEKLTVEKRNKKKQLEKGSSFSAWCLWVLKNELGSDWHVKPGEPYCWLKRKVITFDFKIYNGDYAAWLHEIAHAKHPHPEKICPHRKHANYYHGYHWAAKFKSLVCKYLITRHFVMAKQKARHKDCSGL